MYDYMGHIRIEDTMHYEIMHALTDYCMPLFLDPSVLAGSLLGHTDAVWGLAYSGIKNRLLSCSADGTIKLWNPQEKLACLYTFNSERGECVLIH